MDANDYQQMLMQGGRQRAGDTTVPDKYVQDYYADSSAYIGTSGEVIHISSLALLKVCWYPKNAPNVIRPFCI